MSIHPHAVDWRPVALVGAQVGRNTAYSSRLGHVYKSATGLWQATSHMYGDQGEHKTRKRAQEAVQNATTYSD